MPLKEKAQNTIRNYGWAIITISIILLFGINIVYASYIQNAPRVLANGRVFLVYSPSVNVNELDVGIVNGGEHLMNLYDFVENRTYGLVFRANSTQIVIRSPSGKYVYDFEKAKELDPYFVLLGVGNCYTILLNKTKISYVESRIVWILALENITVNGENISVGTVLNVSLTEKANAISINDEKFIVYMSEAITPADEMETIKTLSSHWKKVFGEMGNPHLVSKAGEVMLVSIILLGICFTTIILMIGLSRVKKK